MNEYDVGRYVEFLEFNIKYLRLKYLERFTTNVSIFDVINISIREVPTIWTNFSRSKLYCQMNLWPRVSDKIVLNLNVATKS